MEFDETTILRAQLDASEENSAEHQSVLNALATLKLNQGHVAEAQALFQRLLVLRQGDLQIAAEQVRQASSQPAHENGAGGTAHHAPLPDDSDAAAAGPSSAAAAAATLTPAAEATASGGPPSGSASDDDGWENSWEDSLHQLQPVASKASLTAAAAAGGPSGGAASSTSAPAAPSGGSPAAPSTPNSRTTAGSGHAATPPRSAAKPGHVKSSGSLSRYDDEEDSGEARPTAAPNTLDHVLEAYNLDPSSSARGTAALQAFIEERCVGVVKPALRLVDDRHALIVCPTVSSARQLLALVDSPFQLRPFAQASATTQQWPSAELLPPTVRPKTTAAVARRLLSHALGLPGLRDKGAEQVLAAQRKEARDGRRARVAAREEVWGDDADA